MNERDFARSVRRQLDAGLDALAPVVLQRLRTAREAALARTGKAPAPLGAASGPARGWPLGAAAAATVVLTVGVLFWQPWAQYGGPGRAADYAEVDTEVLTDDLPVVAYLDPGFEIWLYHHSAAGAGD